MNREIGWMFPPTNGGASDGFNDSGIAHFKGSPMSSLARETIQNSLDARKEPTEPVHVSFELVLLTANDFGADELRRAIDQCLESPYCNSAAEIELKDARGVLDTDSVQCLRVSDRNTTGLLDNEWRALVKTRGLSFKQEGAGGSHGIGKAAPFAVTPLRTVLYYTHYRDSGRSFEKFQGKAVLMSHIHDGRETQGTGFFGIKDGCREVTGKPIPTKFRLPSSHGGPVEGTSLHILGFRAHQRWRQRIAASVISNYFYAISSGSLDVIVEPDATLEARNLVQIDKASLQQWFEYFELDKTDGGDDAVEEGGNALSRARCFWELCNSELKPIDKQDKDLGHCRLWIKVADGMPSRVGFVRNTGMLITTQQRNLIRFPGFRDFAALCVFEDPRGNELLRMMENPQHDQFEPSRLPESKRTRGRRALKRITDWIRDEVRKCAGPPAVGGRTVLSELAAYLPDPKPDESFDAGGDGGNKGGEPGFGERVTVRLKPVRRTAPPSLPESDTGDEVEGDGPDTGSVGGGAIGENTGGGGYGGSGEGESQGGSGSRGGTQTKNQIAVSAVRLLPIPGARNCYRLSFRADGRGVVRLDLHEAGDSSTIPRSDISMVTAPGAPGRPLDTVLLADRGRTEVMITADGPVGDRAWRLSAVAVEDKP